MSEPKYNIGDWIVNSSKMWHGGGGQRSDRYQIIGLEGKIIRYCGLKISYGEDGDDYKCYLHVYIVEWFDGGECSKSETQLKPHSKTLRNEKIEKLLNENK